MDGVCVYVCVSLHMRDGKGRRREPRRDEASRTDVLSPSPLLRVHESRSARRRTKRHGRVSTSYQPLVQRKRDTHTYTYTYTERIESRGPYARHSKHAHTHTHRPSPSAHRSTTASAPFALCSLLKALHRMFHCRGEGAMPAVTALVTHCHVIITFLCPVVHIPPPPLSTHARTYTHIAHSIALVGRPRC